MENSYDHEIIKAQGNNFVLANPVAQAKPVVGTGGKRFQHDDWIGKKFANNWEIIRKISRRRIRNGVWALIMLILNVLIEIRYYYLYRKDHLNGYLKKAFLERI